MENEPIYKTFVNRVVGRLSVDVDGCALDMLSYAQSNGTRTVRYTVFLPRFRYIYSELLDLNILFYNQHPFLPSVPSLFSLYPPSTSLHL